MIATRLFTSAPAALAACVLLAAPFSSVLAQEAPAPAQDVANTSPHAFTANVSLVSDYRYRGISQTDRRPAVQGGFDYAHASGFYLGNWNSSISWLGDADASVSAPVEMDFYGGFRNTFKLAEQDINYDVGVLEYYYPGGYTATRPYTTEIYAGVGWGPVFLKYSHAVTNLFGFADSKNSYYIDLTANVPLNVWDLTLNAHVGYQGVQHFSDASYTDWKIGLTRDLGHGFALAVAYIGSNADKSVYTNSRGRYLGKATAFASITKTF
ncbi:TorF family putative porin [Cupriavidus pauculus]|uniref:TorF family putative porin n=1 Tax=Cupriavidus pauculus TaxID=82633 RepID=UPI001D0BFE7A|nr:TorF family putative porin [Cupriavidus pauculus]